MRGHYVILTNHPDPGGLLTRLLAILLFSFPLLAAEPRLIRNLVPDGEASFASNPYGFTEIGARMYFFAFTEADGYELWMVDGSSDPEMVVDVTIGIEPGLGGEPDAVAAAGSLFYFRALDLSNLDKTLLWRSDGTPRGTWSIGAFGSGVAIGERLLVTGRSGSERSLWITDGSQEPALVRNFDDSIAGTVSAGAIAYLVTGSGRLWRSDGTSGGTLDLQAGAAVLPEFVVDGARLWFGTSQSLGVTDGTRAGTTIVKEVGAAVKPLAVAGGVLFFTVGSDLWRSDGTPGGTTQVRAGTRPESWIAYGDLLLMSIDDALWRSDGTETGTFEIAPEPWSGDGWVGFETFGGLVFSQSTDPNNGSELWVTDGTSAGTRLYEDLAPGNDSSRPISLTSALGKLWLVYYSPRRELAVIDAVGRSPRRFDLNPDVSGSMPSGGAQAGDKVVFSAVTPEWGREPWVSDGTAAGTNILADINPGGAHTRIGSMMAGGPLAYFGAHNGVNDGQFHNDLWRTDGSPVGTFIVAPLFSVRLAVIGERFLFRNTEAEVWSTDGTTGGTMRISPEGRALGSASPFGGKLLLTFGDELWTTDGTTEGTRLVTRLSHPGLVLAGPSGAFILGSGRLWTTDGTAEGTVERVGIEHFSEPNVRATNYAVLGDVVLITFDDNSLWRADGTMEGTRELARFELLHHVEVQVAGEWAYFFADDGAHGLELWRTNGTTVSLARDIRVGRQGSIEAMPLRWNVIGDTLYFAASDGDHGYELWRANASGATMVADINPGASGSNPVAFGIIGEELIVRAYTDAVGYELYAIPLEQDAPPSRRRSVRR